MKTVAFFNQKGGVGKTAMAFHFGWFLAEMEKRVLFVDLDPQGNLSSVFETNACLAANIFTKQPPESLQTHEVERSCPSGKRKFSIITADEQLEAVQGNSTGLTGLTRLKKTLRVGEGRWDYVVLDCPPSLGGFSANALVAAQYVVIPCLVKDFSLKGLDHVSQAVATTKEEGLNADLKILAVVLNQFNREAKNKTIFEREISNDVVARYGDLVLPSSIPSSIKIEESIYAKLPIWEYQKAVPKDDSAAAAAHVVRTVMTDLYRRLEGGGA